MGAGDVTLLGPELIVELERRWSGTEHSGVLAAGSP
jgi:hypothetical protein